MKKKIYVVLLIVVTIVLGLIRDYLFVSINHVIESGNDTGGNLSILKWILTFVFSISYFVLTCAFLFVIFRSKKYMWMAIWAYSLLFALSFLAGGSGMLISSFEKVYPFVRTVMGIAQSPIVGMILISACLINEGKKSDFSG